MEESEAVDLPIFMKNSHKERIPLRICAIKKTKEERAKEEKRIQRNNSKKQFKLSEESCITHNYMFVITSLPKTISANEILALYRLRWQIELVFKRLKSILDLGELPKKKESGIVAWINGKLMVALMIEKMLGSLLFSPCREKGKQTKSLERNEINL